MAIPDRVSHEAVRDQQAAEALFRSAVTVTGITPDKHPYRHAA